MTKCQIFNKLRTLNASMNYDSSLILFLIKKIIFRILHVLFSSCCPCRCTGCVPTQKLTDGIMFDWSIYNNFTWYIGGRYIVRVRSTCSLSLYLINTDKSCCVLIDLFLLAEFQPSFACRMRGWEGWGWVWDSLALCRVAAREDWEEVEFMFGLPITR